MADEPLLLHSLSEHRELIFGCLAAASPTRIVEIGSETGGFTRELIDWAGEHGARVTTIEPLPAPEVRALAATVDHFELVEGRSPEALAALPPADAYVVDGDHNHWTVSRELECAFAGERAPLVILHDVGWPCARRDQYYAPDALPAEALLPHSFELGRALDGPELVEGAFRGRGEFAVALREGGPKNGVKTAVEDFLAERPELEYLELPVIFGVGFVFASGAPYAQSVRDLLGPWDGSALARTLEQNRLRLFLRLLELQDSMSKLRLHHNRVLIGYEDRLAEAQAEIAALRLERARLRAHAQQAAPAP